MSAVAADSDSPPGKRARFNLRPIRDTCWIGCAVILALVIASPQPRTALTLVVGVASLVVALERMDIGLGLLVATIPVQDAWPAMLGSHPMPWTRVVLYAVVAAWLARLALGRDRLRLGRVTWWFAAYVGALLLSVVEARNLGLWAQESYRWAAAFAVFAIANQEFSVRPRFGFVWAGFAFGTLFSALIAVEQVITGSGPESFAYRGALRAYGLFGEPNPFAAYLELAVLPLIAAGAFACRGKRVFRWSLVGTSLLLAAAAGAVILGLTQSRGGGIGFAAGLAVVIWHVWPYWGKRIVLAGVALALVVVWTPPAAQLRALFGLDAILRSGAVQVTTANFAAQERLAHWGAALRMWAHSPWLGVGAGNFPERYREYTPVWRFRISRGHAHSAYLQAAAQAGTVGLVCYVGLMVAVWRQCRRTFALASNAARGAAVGGLAVTAAFAVHGIFDYVHVLSLGIGLSVLWGMANDDGAQRLGDAVNHGGN